MIVSFEGFQGSGKTTLAVAAAYEENKKGIKVISNVHLNNMPDYKQFDLAWFIEHLVDHEMENCVLLLDEAYQIFDSRSSQTKMNKLFSYFVVQARKRDVDLYICTHHISHIDLRVQRAVDVRGACRHYKEKPCKKCKCKVCKGTGKIGKEDCPVCKGVGGTGEINGQTCERCNGYGETGVTKGIFLNRRERKRYTMQIFSPDYWHLFATKERIPFQAKTLQGIDTMEVI